MGQRDVIPHLIPYGKTSAGMIVRSCFAGSRLGISREEGVSYVVKTEKISVPSLEEVGNQGV